MANQGPLRRGETVGAYKIDRLIGLGGFAYVYRAINGSGAEVALKVPRPEANVRRFRMEASLGKQLRHPGIVQVFDTGIHNGGLPFITMEFVREPTLSAWRKRMPGGRFPPAAIQGVGLAVSEALGHALGAARIKAHRDVKPANIFGDFQSSAVPAGVKIGDFGIVKHVDSDLTGAMEFIGVASYLAPEVLLGGGYSYASDMFSLGVVLYVMACGRTPFPATGHPLDVASRYVNEPIPPPSQWGIDVGGDLEAVIVTCLRREPEDRFGSLEELSGAFSALGAIHRRATSPAPPRPATEGEYTPAADVPEEEEILRDSGHVDDLIVMRSEAPVSTGIRWTSLILGGLGMLLLGVGLLGGVAAFFLPVDPVVVFSLAVFCAFCMLLGLGGLIWSFIDFLRPPPPADSLVGFDMRAFNHESG